MSKLTPAQAFQKDLQDLIDEYLTSADIAVLEQILRDEIDALPGRKEELEKKIKKKS